MEYRVRNIQTDKNPQYLATRAEVLNTNLIITIEVGMHLFV